MDLIKITEETVNFQIIFGCQYWDKPPEVKIIVDDIVQWQGTIVENRTVEFDCELDYNKNHFLIIHRSGKDSSQTVDGQDQMLWLETAIIDHINVRDLIYHTSEFYPEYPEPWASEQQEQGIELEYPVLGETIWGHNGIWKYHFSTPFYKYVIEKVTGVRR